MKIITVHDVDKVAILEQKALEYKFPLMEEDKTFLSELLVLNKETKDAMAIAAPQVGVSRRAFTIDLGIAEHRLFINPRILKTSVKTIKAFEGCLSIPELTFKVLRPKTINLEYYTIDGERCEESFSGIFSRAIQHEIDHLDGILIHRRAEELMLSLDPRTKFGMKISVQNAKKVKRNRQKEKNRRKVNKLRRK